MYEDWMKDVPLEVECPHCSRDEKIRFSEERKRLFEDKGCEVYINSINELEFVTMPISLEIPINYCPMCRKKVG